jgi:membrane protein required for colicin V production
MATLDYIILAVVLISAIAGLVRGFLREVISLLAWVLAVWLAWKLGPLLVPYLGGALKRAPFGLWAGRGIVFTVVLVVGAIVGAIINHFVRLSIFSGTDRLLGFILGLARGVVILSVLMILAQTVKLDGETWWKRSILRPQIQPVANVLRALAGDRIPGSANDGTRTGE